MIGRILNERYEIVELIGRGGMAYVYKAKDLKLNRFVAVKVLREEYTENEQFIKKFDRESQAAAGLSHPNIVSVYDVGVDGDVYFIVMEYVDGITLKQYLDKKGHLEYEEATNFIIDIAEALKCAHAHQIIHRDIKPQNIMLTADLMPKVTDFGIARAITSSTITMTNQTMGSVHYISPEQARGGFVDERSDLYSLGIMYYELLTGQLPFDEESTVTIAIKHIQEDITPPMEINPDIPQSVNDVVVKLCEKKPEDRYQNTDELIDDLDQIMLDANVDLNNGNDPGLLDNAGILDEDSLFKVEPGTEAIPKVEAEKSDVDELKRRKKRNKIIAGVIGGIILLLVAILAVNAMMGTKKVTVPDVSNMTKDQATAAAQAVGMKVEVEKEVNDNDVESGKIISQTPAAGTESQSGKTIKVSISKGSNKVGVPTVVGMAENDAVAALEKSKLTVSEIKREYNDNYDTGVVFKVSPDQGTEVDENSQVVLYVSKGQNTVSVPGIVGLTNDAAQNRITSNGFTVGTVTQQSSDQYAAGVVISQSPAEGTQTDRGSAINYVVSTGPAPTPTPSPSPTVPATPTPSGGQTQSR
ncbi:MAG: Stk1 family PASTA domain-containing Ser/Thr kinase [Eubacteriaceae bacterium]|nr:Stk1 family PASTA domain-containing Ser/Thr kinase [Eubacteriaceae bacterium]MDD4507529.1 Stk1 family PASTA domain-containing Ser/Thr kinase [Eubacteriaceae bacterium]